MAEKWESWKSDISPESLESLEWLGHFGPTYQCDFIKGYMDQEETYLTASDCEKLGNALLEVAKWLRNKEDKEDHETR